MRLAKSLSALTLTLFMLGVAASCASAAAKTTSGEWYSGSPLATTLTTDQALSGKTIVGGTWLVTTTIGGKAVEFTSTGMECISCTITNAEVTSKSGKVAMTRGKVKWTGVTVDKPSGCILVDPASGTAGVYTSKSVVVHDDWMNEAGTIAYHQFIPETGETLASFRLEGSGQCESIECTYSMAGTLFAESANATGVQAAEQNLLFSPSIESATGSALKIGPNAASLTGTTSLSIGGSAFGVH